MTMSTEAIDMSSWRQGRDGRVLREGMDENTWVSEDGRAKAIKDMHSFHIINTVRKYRAAAHAFFADCGLTATDEQVDAFLTERIVPWKALIEEGARRGLSYEVKDA